MIRVIFSLILIMGLSSCGSKSQDKVVPNAVRAVNESGVSAAESMVCKSTEQLEEIEITDAMTVYYDMTNFSLFSFIKNNQGCALTNNYNKNGLADLWYNLTVPDSCVSNGSLWELKTITRENNATNLTLQEFGSSGSGARSIKIQSGFSIKLKELSLDVGMHFLKCMPKNQK
jgi:hypothetical protein